MAQLLKLQDYISRYEQHIYEYPSRFIRLKQQNWKHAKRLFDEGMFLTLPHEEVEESEEPKASLFQSIKGYFQKENKEQVEELGEEDVFLHPESVDQDLHVYSTEPRTIEDAKILFLENLLEMQIKWASSTAFEISNVDRRFYHDPVLRYLLQRFPDTYLILYKPIFAVRKATVEVDIVVLTPMETWCISIIESQQGSVFQYSKDRFWTELFQEKQKKIVNPLLSLNRMGSVVQGLYEANGLDIPIKRILLSRNGYFDCPTPPYGIELVDARSYDKWFQKARKSVSPLKHSQLKAANALLRSSQTTAETRI